MTINQHSELTYFRHVWTKARLLEPLPPGQELMELFIPSMDFKLELSEWKGLIGSNVRFHDRCEGFEFPTFDIDFEDVDVGVTCCCKRKK